MAEHRIERLEIKGFKSIRDAKVDLRPLNVLIGENGSGKSNFVEAFRLLHALSDESLQEYIARRGVENLLYLGSEITDSIRLRVEFPPNAYSAELAPYQNAEGENLYVEQDRVEFHSDRWHWDVVTRWNPESGLRKGSGYKSKYVRQALDSWVVYHFHDTSSNAKCRGFASLYDYDRLRAEGENLAAYLYRLKTGNPDDQVAYGRIERLIRLTLPFFDRFVLEPTPGRAPGNEDVLLRWRQKGSDFPFTAQHLSDGSLRYILLTTALNQPLDHRPTTMVIDEPELGLHPRMLGFLAGQIKSVAAAGQVIVATQSSTFLDEFEPEDVIVVDRDGAESRFRRLPLEELKTWLDDYTLSDLVWKGVIGGASSVF